MSDAFEEDDFHIAEQAFVEGNLGHAVEHLASVVIAEPERRDARELFARITAESEDPLALVALQDENFAGTIALRSLLLSRLGRGDEAIALLLQCVLALPDSSLLLWLQEWSGNPSFVQSLDVDAVAFELHRFAFAVNHPDRHAELRDAVENMRLIHPRHERLAYVHVFTLRRCERYDEAVAIARDLFGDSGEFEWVVALAATYRDAGMLDDALAMYERALSIDDSDEAIFLDVADVNLEKGLLEPAIAAYEAALAREPEQAWALASLSYARYRQTGDPVYLDDLAERAANGDDRAAALENLALPFFGYLPLPAEATINLLEQVVSKGLPGTGSLASFSVSHIETPSSRMAADAFVGTRVPVSIHKVPTPDPRYPSVDVPFRLWNYEGTEPHAALDHPTRRDVIDAVIAIAETPYSAAAWYAMAGDAKLVARDEETLRELLAVMVHPPLDENPRPWRRIQRVQFAAAMLIAALDPATDWPWSMRRKGLHALIHGPVDWTTEAALIALTVATLAGEADAKEALRWMKALYERRPSEGAWSLQHALLTSMLRMPNLDDELRDALTEERRELVLEDDGDEGDEPIPPPAPQPSKPFWKRWLGL